MGCGLGAEILERGVEFHLGENCVPIQKTSCPNWESVNFIYLHTVDAKHCTRARSLLCVVIEGEGLAVGAFHDVGILGLRLSALYEGKHHCHYHDGQKRA